MRFDSYHPTINLIFFSVVITATIFFQHPVFVAISYICSFIYSVKLNKSKAVIFNVVILFFISFFVYYYVSFNHFGVTTLKKNIIDNSITLESLVYAIILGFIIASVVMWLSCLHAVFSKDKIVYVFGRILPKLSLFISIILRTVPRIKERYCKIHIAQQAIGKGINHGNILRRLKNLFRIISILITWSIEDFVQVSDSMKCRGYTLKGRSCFSIYRFDNRDRSFITTMFLSITMLIMATMFDQIDILYNPRIVFNKITYVSYFFYISYILIALLPFFLQTLGEIKFNKLSRNIKN